MKTKLFRILFLPLMICSGCITTDSPRIDETTKLKASIGQQISELRSRLNAIEGRIEELEFRVTQLEKSQEESLREFNFSLNTFKKEIQNYVKKESLILEDKVTGLERKIREYKEFSDKKYNIIVKEVSRDIKRLDEEISEVKKGFVSKGGTYIVKKGDTLSEIAKKFGVSMKAIMDINNIDDPNHIRVGQKLKIP